MLSLALIPRDAETLDALGEACVRLEDAFLKLQVPARESLARRALAWLFGA